MDQDLVLLAEQVFDRHDDEFADIESEGLLHFLDFLHDSALQPPFYALLNDLQLLLFEAVDVLDHAFPAQARCE